MEAPIAILRREHEHILTAVDALQRVARGLATNGNPGAKDARALLAFLKAYADDAHHGKEEGFLFPAMIAAGVPQRSGPVSVMLAEHEQGREAVRAMDAALGRGPDGEGFAQAAAAYAALLRAHIMKENDVLFPMAERMLGPLEWHAMAQGFADHEARALSGGRRDVLEAELGAVVARYA
jgi:hemerythrin-like domain-containing protein